MGAGVDVGFGKNVRPTSEMVGTAIPGTAISGVRSVSGPLMALQNSPLGDQNFPHNPHRSRTGVLGGIHKSGYHPSVESGYGIRRLSKNDELSGFSGNFDGPERRINENRYEEPDTYTSTDVKALQEEYDKQQQIMAAQRQQFAELAAGSGTPQPRGAGSVNVGSRGQIQINPLNPVAQIKQPDILTGPFLGRWRR